MEDKIYKPMKEKELAIILRVAPEDREEFKSVLEELLLEGRIERTKRGRYQKPEAKRLSGTFIANMKGFGFVKTEGFDEDLFIPEEYTSDAFHGDLVEVELLPRRGGRRQEAKIVSVVERVLKKLVGTYESSKNFGFVIPDDKKIAYDIFIPIEKSMGAVDGHKVVVELTGYGDAQHNPEGIVTEILGHVNDPGVDIMSIVKGYDLPEAFNEKVLNQANRVAKDVSEADMAGRADLRDVLMVTIDGEDAKDLDDAVSLTRDGDLYELGVHIADVANYVQEHSALDREAFERGTSVYLVDRVIPMLPHTLSNGICSLNMGENRLAVSCIMKVDEKGDVKDYRITESVICVDRRMNYTDVAKILEDHDPELMKRDEAFLPMLEDMAHLASILRDKRKKRGAVDFDFPETKIVLDEKGTPLSIKPYARNTATDLIEDFMLLANETVALHFFWQEIPFLYRTHETPDMDKIRQLVAFIRNFGYSMKVSQEELHPKELQKLLAKVAGSDEEMLIDRLALRSMRQAKYTTENSGHFGLALGCYTHFTSPIRRYPDLQIHRIIKEQIRGRLNEDRTEHYKEILTGVARHASETERRADEAERETVKLKKAQYMEAHIDECFDGIISGITEWGIYVELPNTIEGLIRVSDLDGDFYEFDRNRYEMIGHATGKAYRLGDLIRIRVKDADRNMRTVDFTIADDFSLEDDR